MSGDKMTRAEKEALVSRISDLALRDVLTREDMVWILKICADACYRRISDIERELPTPAGKAQ